MPVEKFKNRFDNAICEGQELHLAWGYGRNDKMGQDKTFSAIIQWHEIDQKRVLSINLSEAELDQLYKAVGRARRAFKRAKDEPGVVIHDPAYAEANPLYYMGETFFSSTARQILKEAGAWDSFDKES